jgi:hypothetical protein
MHDNVRIRKIGLTKYSESRLIGYRTTFFFCSFNDKNINVFLGGKENS